LVFLLFLERLINNFLVNKRKADVLFLLARWGLYSPSRQQERCISVFPVGGSSCVKLRDVGQAVNFGVTYDTTQHPVSFILIMLPVWMIIKVLDMEGIVHLLINEELRNKQNIPHTCHWHQEQ